MPITREVDPNLGSAQSLFGENDPNLSNESIVLDPIDIATFPNGLPPDTILGRVTATGRYRPLDPAATDGTENFGGILYHHAPPNVAVQRNVAVVRHQKVNGNLVKYAIAVSAPQRAAVEAQAANAQVMIRY